MIYVLLPSYFLGVNMCCVDILDFFYKKISIPQVKLFKFE